MKAEYANQSISSTVISKCCRVCGDTALGYNFNVVSCESCKAFFRRNALRDKKFKCAFDNSCEITHVSRRFCQKCRLQKCFQVGMKKEHILTDEKLKNKRQQYKNRKMTKSTTSSVSSPLSTTTNGDSNHHNHSLELNQTNNPALQPEGSATEAPIAQRPQRCCCECRCGYHPPGTTFKNILEHNSVDAKLSPSTPQSSNESFEQPLAIMDQQTTYQNNSDQFPSNPNNANNTNDSFPQRFGLMPDFDNNNVNSQINPTQFIADGFVANFFSTDGFGQFSNGIDNNNLFTEENQKAEPVILNENSTEHSDANLISELKTASAILMEPVERPGAIDSNVSIADVIRMIDIAIRRLIEMSKKLAGFAPLSQDDQIALLKGGCTEMMILRGAMTFEADQAAWRPYRTQMSIKMDVLTGFNRTIYEGHKRFLGTFEQSWRTNETVMLLMTAMILFDPTRVSIQHPDLVKQQYNRYAQALKRYLDADANFPEPNLTYQALLGKLDELRELNVDAVRYFLDIDPKDIGPLLIEIFDLR